MTTPATSPAIRELVTVVTDLVERVDRLERGGSQAQLPFTSVDDAPLEFRDAAGNTRVIAGKQPDLDYAVTYVGGPKPPRPTLPITSSEQLNGIVAWDGGFEGGVARPSGVAGVDVHVGDDPDFTLVDADPDASGEQVGTAYVTLFDRGLEAIAMGAGTRWVRFVAVTRSGVRSDPTEAVPVSALPVEQFAVGSVKAEHIDFEATENGNTLSLNESGLLVARGDGSIAFYLQTADATVLSTGEYRTRDEGERVVINPGGSDPTAIRGYPTSGSAYAALRAFTDNGQGYWRLSGGGTGPVGRVYAWPGWATLRSENSDGSVRSQVDAFTDWTVVSGPENYIDSTSGAVHLRASGSDDLMVLNGADGNPFGRAQLYGNGSGGSLVFENGRLSCEDLAENSIPIWASELDTRSSRHVKTGISPLSFDPLGAVRGAPSSMWQYDPRAQPRSRPGRPDPGPPRPARTHVGPMAEDLPAELVTHSDNGEAAVGLRDMVGVLWAAVAELADRVDGTPGPR